ncbi:MAG TPA: hypothetical protein VIL49_16205 [Capillimicrobium sp.]
MRLSALAAATVLAAAALASAAHAAEPRLTVPRDKLDAGLKCTDGIDGAARTPVMLVTGTGASGDEAYAIGKPAFDLYGAPVCWVNFPHNTTADIQVSVQYLVHGLRVMERRAGRPVAVFGISQGGLLPRVALTYWPSLRPKVTDVLSAAGTHHGTRVRSVADCEREGCTPAGFQQAADSAFQRALNDGTRDETPGPTAWTTVRSATDETVRPTRGPRPTSALEGATNVLIQDVCPGRRVTHIGTALDSVTFALAIDAVEHRGPARVSRLPRDICERPYAAGLDPAATASTLTAADALTAGRQGSEPRVDREPRVRVWMTR